MDMAAFVRALQSGRAEDIAPFIDEIRGGGESAKADTYTKKEIDNRLGQRALSRDVYSKEEVDEKFAELSALLDDLTAAE
jgi:hypothetical protein